MPQPQRTPDQLIVIGICLICLAGLAPFSVIRFLSGEYRVAMIDLIGVVASVTCIFYVWVTGRSEPVGRFLALLAVTGMTANVIQLGIGDVYFLYPVFIAAFFLAPPGLALVLTMASTLAIGYFLSSGLTNIDIIKVVLSLAATSLFAFTFAFQRNRQRDALQSLSRTDTLTGAGNRRALHDQMEEWIASVQRDAHPMSLLIIDLDDFKVVNDQHGHLVGDQVLKALAERIRSRIRTSDHLYRFGGDEFIVLANHSGAETALKLAEDILSRIAQTDAIDGVRLTVSIGVSQYQTGETADQWLSRADAEMYGAKVSGKNQVLGVAPTL